MSQRDFGRLVLYREKQEGMARGFEPTAPIEVARVVEYQPEVASYLVRPLGRIAESFVIEAQQVVAEGYLMPWPPPDRDRKQVMEGVGGRLEVLGKECTVLAEKLRRLSQ
jgi:hypothetical protein